MLVLALLLELLTPQAEAGWHTFKSASRGEVSGWQGLSWVLTQFTNSCKIQEAKEIGKSLGSCLMGHLHPDLCMVHVDRTSGSEHSVSSPLGVTLGRSLQRPPWCVGEGPEVSVLFRCSKAGCEGSLGNRLQTEMSCRG